MDSAGPLRRRRYSGPLRCPRPSLRRHARVHDRGTWRHGPGPGSRWRAGEDRRPARWPPRRDAVVDGRSGGVGRHGARARYRAVVQATTSSVRSTAPAGPAPRRWPAARAEAYHLRVESAWRRRSPGCDALRGPLLVRVALPRFCVTTSSSRPRVLDHDGAQLVHVDVVAGGCWSGHTSSSVTWFSMTVTSRTGSGSHRQRPAVDSGGRLRTRDAHMRTTLHGSPCCPCPVLDLDVDRVLPRPPPRRTGQDRAAEALDSIRWTFYGRFDRGHAVLLPARLPVGSQCRASSGGTGADRAPATFSGGRGCVRRRPRWRPRCAARAKPDSRIASVTTSSDVAQHAVRFDRGHHGVVGRGISVDGAVVEDPAAAARRGGVAMVAAAAAPAAPRDRLTRPGPVRRLCERRALVADTSAVHLRARGARSAAAAAASTAADRLVVRRSASPPPGPARGYRSVDQIRSEPPPIASSLLLADRSRSVLGAE